MGLYASGFWYSTGYARLCGRVILLASLAWESYSNISNLIPSCLMWIVWLDQNRRSFDDIKKRLEEFYASIVFLIGLNAGVL